MLIAGSTLVAFAACTPPAAPVISPGVTSGTCWHQGHAIEYRVEYVVVEGARLTAIRSHGLPSGAEAHVRDTATDRRVWSFRDSVYMVSFPQPVRVNGNLALDVAVSVGQAPITHCPIPLHAFSGGPQT